MTGLWALVKRNTKLYFKDKGMFISSLITPIILLVLYSTFLKKVYDDSFRSALKAAGASISDAVLNGCVGGQLISSLLAVSCVTVAFCSNLLMIKDKTGGARHDLTVSPVHFGTLGLSYYISTLISTLIISFAALGAVYIPFGGRLVFIGGGYCAYDTGCFSAYNVRHGAFLLHKFLFINRWSGIGGRHNSERRLRLYMRGIYAYFQFRQRAAKGAFLPAGNLRHKSFEKPRNARRICRNENTGLSG